MYEFGPYRVDPADRRLTRGNEIVHLQPKVFDLLVALVEKHGHLVTKAELLARVWPDTFVEEGILTTDISILRKTLRSPGDDDPIETIPRVGYRFTAAVRVVPSTTPAPPPAAEASPVQGPAVGTRSAAPARRFMPVAAALLAIAMLGVAAWWRLSVWPDNGVIGTMAVLPFEVLGPPEEAAHLSVAMADAITTRLASFGSIRVPPSATTNYFSARHASPADVGRALRVDGVVTGTVQRADDRIRVTVQLSRVSNGAQVWAGRFDERFTNVFSMQDAIADQIAPILVGSASRRASPAAERSRPTDNVAAYDLYLKARDRAATRTMDTVRTSIRMFDDAIRLDPQFAAAYAGLADAYSTTASGLAPSTRYPLAKAAAERALALDPNLAEAHVSLAFVMYKSEWRWRDAEAALNRAIELDPDYSFAYLQRGELRKFLGRLDEALADFEQVRQLDPYSLHARQDQAGILLLQGHVARAREVVEGGLEQDPNAWEMRQALAEVLAAENRQDESIDEDLRSRQLAGQPAIEIDALRAAYRRGGWQEYLRIQNTMLLDRYDRNVDAPKGVASSLAVNHALLGNAEEAMTWLERAAVRGEEGPLYLNYYRCYEFLRSHPRFQALHRKVFGGST